jgi:hypothetical protein
MDLPQIECGCGCGLLAWRHVDCTPGLDPPAFVPPPIVSDGRAILAGLIDESFRLNAGAPPGTPVEVTYAFAGPDDLDAMLDRPLLQGFGIERLSPFTSAQRGSFEAAVDRFEAAAGLTFREVAEIGEATIDIVNGTGLRPPGGWAGLASLPLRSEEADQGFLVMDAPGSFEPGTGPFVTLLHEIGHAVGLSHTFEPPFRLAAALDRTSQTVMSYNTELRPTLDLGPLDVEALRLLYGPPPEPSREGGGGPDRLRGGAAADVLAARRGDDTIFGGAGDDRLEGGAGDDLLRGEAEDDRVLGGDGSDRLLGGTGDDLLRGGAGDDLIAGGAGRDTLSGGSGDDGLLGGTGLDAFHFSGGRDTVADWEDGEALLLDASELDLSRGALIEAGARAAAGRMADGTLTLALSGEDALELRAGGATLRQIADDVQLI